MDNTDIDFNVLCFLEKIDLVIYTKNTTPSNIL
jgi:hypothetical protein